MRRLPGGGRSPAERKGKAMTSAETAPEGTVAMGEFTGDELGLAVRNHGFLLEALSYPVTPVGMHYLLSHYDVPRVDVDDWALEITGRVDLDVRLTLEELRARPRLTQRVTTECAGNGRAGLSPRPLSQPWNVEAVGTGEWTGTALGPLLEEVGLSDDAVEVVFTGLDAGIEKGIRQHYERSLTVEQARREEVMVAYELNGQLLPPQHGFPLRLVVPGWYGMGNVKWLSRITVVDEPFTGYQQSSAYRWRTSAEERGSPMTRMLPRSLLAPPGIPDFFTRARTLGPGPVTLVGRAWSGHGEIRGVKVSVDDGATWSKARLDSQQDPYAWVGWSYAWDAAPGDHMIACRATDTDGNEQPLQSEWNLGGYACNGVQRVPVRVE